MKCQRCSALSGSDAVVRIRTDIIDLAVCHRCAIEASALGLTPRPLAAPMAADKQSELAAAA